MNGIAKDLILPEEALEILQRCGVVHVGFPMLAPTHRVTAGGGLGVFDLEARGFIERHIMLTPAFAFRRREG
jgi:hypothetical protein